MRKKAAKKLKKLAQAIGIGKPQQEVDKIYKRLKTVHNTNKSKV